MLLRAIMAGVALLIGAGAAGAQITTFVAPPRSSEPQMVAMIDSTRKDSVAMVQLTNMKAWVDSAAGVTVPSGVGAVDSTALVNDPGRPVAITFSDGSVAPATASALPAIMVVGFVVFAAGTVLLATRPRG